MKGLEKKKETKKEKQDIKTVKVQSEYQMSKNRKSIPDSALNKSKK